MLRPILLLTLTALCTSFGCTVSDDEACADDQVYENGLCRAKPAGSAGSAGSSSTGGSDAGSPAVGEGGSSGAPVGGTPTGSEGGLPADVAFGASCETHADCGGSTDYCAISPLAPPYCSAQGCDETPDICPEGWSCFDVSQFDPGEPWICLQPS